MRSQKAVSDHFTSEQILLFGFAEQHTCMRRCGKTSASSFMEINEMNRALGHLCAHIG